MGSLRNLTLLDLSFNKIIDFDKLAPLQISKKLSILSLEGNIIAKSPNYMTLIVKMFPSIKTLDPPSIRALSQFQSMEAYCFTDLPENF